MFEMFELGHDKSSLVGYLFDRRIRYSTSVFSPEENLTMIC